MSADGAVEASGGYSIAFYRRGPAWDRQKPLGEQPAIHDHVAYLQRLIVRGSVSQAGPFHGFSDTVEEALVGLVVFRTGLEEAEGLVEQDPAVRARLMECEVLPWYP